RCKQVTLELVHLLAVAGAQSRSEDEESLGVKDVKRTATQALAVVSIKRKKFDDELVESSLVKSSSRVKGPPVISLFRCSGSEPSSSEKKKVRMTIKSTDSLSQGNLGRWKPTDDLLLINAVLQVSANLKIFSCRFTFGKLKRGWYALLYDPVISKLAWQAMRQLHPEYYFWNIWFCITFVIEQTSQPKLTACWWHWQLLKQYYLLDDQSGEFHCPHLTIKGTILPVKRQKREIRQLEQELPRWQVLVDSITGMSMPDFDNQTPGSTTRYEWCATSCRSREIYVGRATKDKQIDVDLSLDGPAWKISRKQGD
uniref:Microspherule protein 1 n=1 Tax=Seriola dumerili TaxID=41447 RepID=A0A3B4TJM3_SERDU